MEKLVMIAVVILTFGMFTYPKWSYKQYERRCKLNSLHPDWKPKCGINYLEKDKNWFIQNGYGDGYYISDKQNKQWFKNN